MSLHNVDRVIIFETCDKFKVKFQQNNKIFPQKYWQIFFHLDPAILPGVPIVQHTTESDTTSYIALIMTGSVRIL